MRSNWTAAKPARISSAPTTWINWSTRASLEIRAEPVRSPGGSRLAPARQARPAAQALALRRGLRRGADALRGARRGRADDPVVLDLLGPGGAKPRGADDPPPRQSRGDAGRAAAGDRQPR